MLVLHNSHFQTHLSFGQEFTQAVEMKQVGKLYRIQCIIELTYTYLVFSAQQEAERARFLVEKVELTL